MCGGDRHRSASIIVALAFGESVSHYSMQQMSQYLKTDEIEVYPGQVQSGEDEEIAKMTEQKIELIRSLPQVAAVLPQKDLGYYQFVVDGSKWGNVT